MSDGGLVSEESTRRISIIPLVIMWSGVGIPYPAIVRQLAGIWIWDINSHWDKTLMAISDLVLVIIFQ